MLSFGFTSTHCSPTQSLETLTSFRSKNKNLCSPTTIQNPPMSQMGSFQNDSKITWQIDLNLGLFRSVDSGHNSFPPAGKPPHIDCGPHLSCQVRRVSMRPRSHCKTAVASHSDCPDPSTLLTSQCTTLRHFGIILKTLHLNQQPFTPLS
ncbi:carboxylate-amine ligase Mkms_4460 [Striga asiatica]|uniref:Carboxylate-amine ligase Mkms_4460 n=1 Tax=Striga asiatica TaxID=4170 RepID=A0A5A7R2I7_STRAF|nr:carboxylate-amine ligase Mkms_4460 [Striga asiatica]